tara:strand:+ start:145 stop:1302 length:1158 start_codon:yes stop_codon:yes gene_type:complete
MSELKRRKVMTIVGTRPEIIKLSRVIGAVREHFDHVLVHTGQNYDYELNEVFFKDLDVPRPDHMLDAVGGSLAETIGNVITKIDPVLEREAPDALLLLGDTNSCLAAIAAKRRKIPIFHMEAGNRCFDLRVPEEINRKIVDHLSDVNMPYTEHARRYLLAEGLKPETVIKTGSPMPEVLDAYRASIDAAGVHSELGLESGKYFVVSTHREESVDDPVRLTQLLHALNAVCATWKLPVIVSTHARTRKRLEALTDQPDMDPLVRFMKPLGFFDYVRLQRDAFCVMSDSGTITEESAILGFPAITLRDTHERPEGMDEGTLIMSGIHKDRVVEAVRIVTEQWRDMPGGFRRPTDYEPENVSAKVVRIIASYIDFVNRTTWAKPTAWA